MARPRPLHALSTDLLFHRVGISRRRAAHEPKRLESPEFRPFPLALRLSYRADCQVSSCPFRPQVCGTSNRQNGTITTVQGNLPHYNSHGFNHLRLSNRPLTLRPVTVASRVGWLSAEAISNGESTGGIGRTTRIRRAPSTTCAFVMM